MSRTEKLPKGVVVGERRRSPRLDVSVPCQAVIDEEFFLLGDEIVDLSADGLLLRANGIPALIGEEVIVSFRPPKSAVWIDADAVIVRLLNGSMPGAPGFGLELRDLSPFDRARLAATVRIARSEQRRARRPGSLRRPGTRNRIRLTRSNAVKRQSVVRVGRIGVHVPRPHPMKRIVKLD